MHESDVGSGGYAWELIIYRIEDFGIMRSLLNSSESEKGISER